MSRSREQARVFLAFAPTLVAGMRASSGFRDLDWPSLRLLHLLSLTGNRLTIAELAWQLGLDPTGVSKLAEKLRQSGYVDESRCSQLPNRCPSPRPNGMPCNKHKFQELTEAGREVAADWEAPYLTELMDTEPLKWVSLGPKLRRLHRRVKAKHAKRGGGTTPPAPAS